MKISIFNRKYSIYSPYKYSLSDTIGPTIRYIKPKPDQTDLKLLDQWLYGKCIFSKSVDKN